MRTVISRLIDFTTAVALKAGMKLSRKYNVIILFFTLSKEGQLAFVKKLDSSREGHYGTSAFDRKALEAKHV